MNKQLRSIRDPALCEVVWPCVGGMALLSFGPAGFVLSSDMASLISRLTMGLSSEIFSKEEVISWLRTLINVLNDWVAMLSKTS